MLLGRKIRLGYVCRGLYEIFWWGSSVGDPGVDMSWGRYVLMPYQDRLKTA